MSDIIDVATDYLEASTNAAIAQIRQSTQGEGSSHCEECSVEIPLARRAFLPNTKYCVECAELMEKSAQRHAKR